MRGTRFQLPYMPAVCAYEPLDTYIFFFLYMVTLKGNVRVHRLHLIIIYRPLPVFHYSLSVRYLSAIHLNIRVTRALLAPGEDT